MVARDSSGVESFRTEHPADVGRRFRIANSVEETCVVHGSTDNELLLFGSGGDLEVYGR